jgi:hypothetical protein
VPDDGVLARAAGGRGVRRALDGTADVDGDAAARRAREHDPGSDGQHGDGKYADDDKGTLRPRRAAPELSQLHPPIPSPV